MKTMANEVNKANALAKGAADELRRMAFYREERQEDIADRLNLSRQSLSKKLNSGELKISEFVNIAMQLGISPSEAFRRAEQAADSDN